MIGETVQVTTPGAATSGRDEQGNPLVSAGATTDLYVWGWAPNDQTETVQTYGPSVLESGKLFAPFGTTVTPSQRITIRGVSGYQVDGGASSWVNIYDGRGKGVVIPLRRSA